uniref:ATP synthase complex subunit 8 n=1 Tax=Glyptotermes sp. 3 AB-2022a TaxID=2942727 RepID=A0A8X8M1T7_9NEOP|nr:ATP synthase F0 subunit 8 [Glyptotermes sp. 3 AB-2022a]
MPQMMPLSWVTLFIMFSTAFILFNTMNYYSHIPKTTITSKNEIKTKTSNWKW